jgi:hypothetical protein
MWPLAVDIIGNVMVISTHSTQVRYIGMFLMCAGSFLAFNVLKAWVGNTVLRTRTKRAITYAIVNMIGNTANIYGVYFFPTTDSPLYIPGEITFSSFAFAGIIAAKMFRLYLPHVNKKTTEAENDDRVIRYKFLY